MSWTLEFYRSADGKSPVEDWLDGLDAREATRVAQGLDVLRTFGTDLGMPHVRNLEREVRVFGIRLRGRPEHRVFHAELSGQRLLILHGLTKTAPGSPPGEADLSLKRLLEYRARKGSN